MDALDVLLKSRQEGGEARKSALEYLIVRARQLGCTPRVSDSREGGFTICYGSTRYAVLDVNAGGRVDVHVKAHPTKELPTELNARANAFIASLEGMTIKDGPIHCTGQAEQPIEEIPRDSLDRLLTYAVNTIQEQYYNNHS
ncbi:MAG: hypothetical protein AAFS10_15615 [Myxococcota bacterium]